MRKLMACLVALTLLVGASQSRADVIYSTLGAGDSFNTGTGWSITSGQYIAMPFTVAGADYNFTSAEVALFGGGGGGNVLVRLRADNAGLPGTILETIAVGGVTGTPTLLTANSTSQSLLQDGSTYWIEVLPDTTLGGGWNWTSGGLTGPFAASFDGGTTYFNFNSQLSAFRVNGTPTPEPISLLVFGGLVVGGGLVARKRLAKKVVA